LAVEAICVAVEAATQIMGIRMPDWWGMC